MTSSMLSKASNVAIIINQQMLKHNKTSLCNLGNNDIIKH